MIRVLIADSRASRREQIRAALAADAEIEIVGQARDGQEAVQRASALRPDLVLLADDLAVQDGFATAELLAASGLPLHSILLSEGVLPDDLRRAMRAGARECLAWSCSDADLREALRAVYDDSLRRRSPAFAAAADPQAGARVIAVSGAKGGIGKTTLAVNLAAALTVETGQPTVLLDLYTQFGDTALLLNLSPRRTLADLVRLDPGDLDERLLEDHLERHECGLRVLPGANAPLPLDALTPDCLDRILSLLKRSHRYLVLDVPPVLHATTLHALTHAHAVLLVANLFDMTTLADSRLWLDAMAGQYVAREAIHLILNRVSSRNRLQIPDIERTLGCAAAGLIPNDGKLVPNSVNAGHPFVLSHPSSRVAQSVFGLARQLAADGVSESAATASEMPRRAAFLSLGLRRGG
ncbi:MAG: AAA family ATPase [Armatimonadota bacterium]|nr:AAA family ATPase [Armatimonadota bacterium]